MKKGFSLVELSVVLIVIGILIAGVMIGKTLSDSARRTAVVADWQKYSTAANNYFTKFGYWPGDDAEAANRWGAAANGNGDGSLATTSPAPATPQQSIEYMYFWEDLLLADFIKGANYSGGWGSGNVPTAAMSNSYMTHYYDSANPTYQAFYITGRLPTSALGVGNSNDINSSTAGLYVLTPRAALAIDTKIDDGFPGTPSSTTNTGNVIAVGGTSSDSLCASSATVYAVTGNSTPYCNLYFIYKK